MQYKKGILAVLLLIVMQFTMLGGIGRAAENDNLIQNGDFESVENGLPAFWQSPVGEVGKNISTGDYGKDGSCGVRLYGKDENVYLVQQVKDIVGGAAYTLSFDMKKVYGEEIFVRIDFMQEKDGKITFLENKREETPETPDLGAWESFTIDITPPEKATGMQIMLRLAGDGDVYFDNISLTGGEVAGEVQPGMEVDTESGWQPAVITDAENMLTNGGFETAAGSWAADWGRFNETDVLLNVDANFAHSGNNSVHIVSPTTTMPWACATINDKTGTVLIGGAEYVASMWMYSPDVANNVAFKAEYYEGDEYGDIVRSSPSTTSEFIDVEKAEGWKKFEFSFIFPEYMNQLRLYVREYGKGEVYIDDVELRLAKGPDALTSFDTDRIFYYSEWEGNGVATALANTVIYPEFIGTTVRFSFRDKTMVLYSKEVTMGADGKATFEFPLSLLEEKQRAYNINCELLDKNGEIIRTYNEEIYKFDRPKYLTEDGFYSEDGGKTIFHPVYVYHITTGGFEKAQEAGINLLQGYATDSWLDKCAELGIKSFIVLYEGGAQGQSAGDPKRINNTIEMVEKYKDHPAVFGWALMDEPPASQADNLERAYIEIRKIDPNHPTFITANGNYKVIQKYCDILSCDQYPYGLKPFTSDDYENIRDAIELVDNRTPVYDLLQAFDTRNSFPTAMEIRNMYYQALWAGAKSVGYYSFNDSQKDAEGNNIAIYNTRLWEPITSFHELEYEDAKKHFITKEYPHFAEKRAENVWFRAWVKGNSIQVVALNKSDKNVSAESFPLTSADGSVSIGDYSCRVINGADKTTFDGNKELKVTLEPGQAVLYEITPKESVDFSGVATCVFQDMYEHGWAMKAVNTLYEDGVLHTNGYTYRPAEEITRGDFVMYLVRTLGLRADALESFSDVDPISYYGKEIAVAKALGIINGVGDDAFMPETPITRQDLMTICARTLEKLGKLEESEEIASFTDSGEISAYAQDAVNRMTGMGIIKGNPDGTIKPLANTTRAEAAVIMERLVG